jgi:hypothetical protein
VFYKSDCISQENGGRAKYGIGSNREVLGPLPLLSEEIEVTRRAAVAGDMSQQGPLLAASLLYVGAPRAEAAARRRIERARQLAL